MLWFSEATGTYTFTPNNTGLLIKQPVGTNDTFFIAINFNGSGTVETGFGGMNGITLGDLKSSHQKFYSSKSAMGNIKVETYGAVGERIKGTFSGTFFNPFTSAEVSITNGRFDVKRLADK